jgi:Flp pilus assembly protein TadG
MPFCLLMFATVELMMVLLACTTLETATQWAGRQIRTGEFQQSGSASQASFKSLVCSQMTWLSGDCPNDLFVEVRTFSNFADLAANTPIPGTTFNPAKPAGDPSQPATCFAPGAPSDIVLVRTYFRWRLFTPLLDAAMANMGGSSGMRLISTATAFRNEPYNETAPKGAAC